MRSRLPGPRGRRHEGRRGIAVGHLPLLLEPRALIGRLGVQGSGGGGRGDRHENRLRSGIHGVSSSVVRRIDVIPLRTREDTASFLDRRAAFPTKRSRAPAQ